MTALQESLFPTIVPPMNVCPACGVRPVPHGAKWCGGACKQAAYRRRLKGNSHVIAGLVVAAP